MNGYITTFYTHLAALSSLRAISAHAVSARLTPVPRALSSSCGTALVYRANTPLLELLHADVEAVYRVKDDGYELVARYE